ncbi:MAG TPA: SagB/ThcOx family dehydrogenase [Terriglobales bacterium]|nr:SagB/ThcOx family dehydrogenase [Terriglobales bacterium]
MFARVLLTSLALLLPSSVLAAPQSPAATGNESISLPKPDLQGKMTLNQALATRRSVREYAAGPLTLGQVSQILWAAHGITGPNGKRTTPSARAVYPLQVWLVANDVTGLPQGIYRYVPEGHALATVSPGDHRAPITAAASGQKSVETAPAVVAIVGDSVLAVEKFHGHTLDWLGMEAGFVIQDVYLETNALGLGTVMVGGFQYAAARQALALPENLVPLGFMPIGRKK